MRYKTMRVLHIEMRGLTASFRVPHMFKYHRSLPLPPYTAVVGMFGAAVGRDMVTAQILFEQLGLKIGIAGTYKGSCNDTWRVLTTKNPENDVVERQILYGPLYHIIFEGCESAIHLCEKAFQFPAYPLSLGRPEDIANAIVYAPFDAERKPIYKLRNTVIVGTPSAWVENSLFDPDDPTDPGPSTLLYRLPVHFNFKNGYTYERVADKFSDFTFIGNHNIILKEPVDGYCIKVAAENGEQELGIPILEV